MDSETRDFIGAEFAKLHERMNAHGELLAKHDDRDNTFEAQIDGLERWIGNKIEGLDVRLVNLTNTVTSLASYVASVHDDVSVLLKAHPNV